MTLFPYLRLVTLLQLLYSNLLVYLSLCIALDEPDWPASLRLCKGMCYHPSLCLFTFVSHQFSDQGVLMDRWFHHKIKSGMAVWTVSSNKDMLLLQVVLLCKWYCWCPRQSREFCIAKGQVWVVQAVPVSHHGYCMLVVVCSFSGEETEYHCCWPEVCLTPTVL